jgi:hypothetical protein
MMDTKGTFRTDPRRNDAEQELAEIRQGVLESLHRSIDDASSAEMFPGLLIEAINNEIWAHPRQMAYKLAPPMPLEEFVTTPFPRGLGTTMRTVRKLIAGNTQAELHWDRAIRGEHGRSNAPRDPKTGRLIKAPKPKPDTANHNSTTGNSAAGGMRRLDKAAQAGDEKAADLLRQVTDPANPKTVHRACIEMGWRQETITVPVDILCDTTIRRIGALHTIQQAWNKANQSERAAITTWLDQQR